MITSDNADAEEMPETLCFTVRDWIWNEFGCMSRMITYSQLEEYLCWAFTWDSKTFATEYCKKEVYGIKHDRYYKDPSAEKKERISLYDGRIPENHRLDHFTMFYHYMFEWM